MSRYILDRIDQNLDRLSRSEARVARWVRAHPRRAVEASIAEVAGAAHVSEPTVIRFCRSMGRSGFRDLKTSLVAALQRPDSYLHVDVTTSDSTMEAAVKVMESSIRALVDLRELASGMPFEAVVCTMATAREIIFAGLGASGHVARDANHKFFRLGIPCSTALDAQTILQRAAISRSGDVYVAVSHTGEWPEMVHAMKVAKAREAKVIALTDPRSPLATAADHVFECHAREDTNVFTPMSSRLAQLALLDALQVALALRLESSAEENLRLSKEALNWQRATGMPATP